MTDQIQSDAAPTPLGAYPHARRTGDLIFLSGIGPRQQGTGVIPGVVINPAGEMVDYDIEAQCRSCFDNVRTVVNEAGSSWDKIVDVLVFLTDMERDFETYNRIYAEYFGEIRPARTTIEVKALPRGGDAPIAIEVKVVAMA